MIKLIPLLLISVIFPMTLSSASLLMWGSQSILIPSLKRFNNEDFDILKEYLRNPKIIAFKGDPWAISDELEELLKNKYTAYVPNYTLDIQNVIELTSDADTNFATIKTTVDQYPDENLLVLLMSTHNRIKRAVDNSTSEDTDYTPPVGKVLYASEKGMLYSSKPLQLVINSTTFYLGKDVSTTEDTRNSYSRLIVKIPTSKRDNINLRFRFDWQAGYWTLSSVEYGAVDGKSITLTRKSPYVSVPRKFSYHCDGSTTFVNEENRVELTIYDMQVQPDSVKGKFSDAIDCVCLVTPPILSGLFVTFLLLIVLFLGLGMLDSIKTMDKFDNSKTKQLSINVAGNE